MPIAPPANEVKIPYHSPIFLKLYFIITRIRNSYTHKGLTVCFLLEIIERCCRGNAMNRASLFHSKSLLAIK
uniref:Uncharacterized protein n=1 Tax=Lepeophtheirus salmonis TaxID=72036 RepID=A0A0K2UJM5_LEPSM